MKTSLLNEEFVYILICLFFSKKVLFVCFSQKKYGDYSYRNV